MVHDSATDPLYLFRSLTELRVLLHALIHQSNMIERLDIPKDIYLYFSTHKCIRQHTVNKLFTKTFDI